MADLVYIGEALFYRQDQRRDKGKFAFEGRSRLGTKTPKTFQPRAEHDVSYNLGVTPYRGKPLSDVEATDSYYQSTRYRGWLTDVKTEAKRLNVSVEDVVKVAGIWAGTTEPSASVWVRGKPRAVQELAKSLGGEYNQDGVLLFSGDRDDGQSAMYTLPGIDDREAAIKAMQKHGIDGGRVVQGRNGQFVLEITDFDGSLYDKVVALGEEMEADVYGTPGTAKLLFGGEHYERRAQPHKGAGITHTAAQMVERLKSKKRKSSTPAAQPAAKGQASGYPYKPAEQ